MQYLLTSVNGVLSIGKRNAKICINMCFTLHFKWIVSVRYIYPKLLTIATWMLPNLNMYVCACAGVCVCEHAHTHISFIILLYLSLAVCKASINALLWCVLLWTLSLSYSSRPRYGNGTLRLFITKERVLIRS